MPLGKIPGFESDGLPPLGEQFYEVAELMGGQGLSRDIAVSAIKVSIRLREIKTVYDPQTATIHPLGILKTIRGLPSYKGAPGEFTTTRKNIVTVARLGGFAAFSINDLAPADGFSPNALDGIRSSFQSVQWKMEAALRTAARPLVKDREALNVIKEMGVFLRR